jgi:two-component system phosphate regulon response regulator PhoB
MSDKKKILVIDDDPDIVTYLTTLLDDNGYVYVSAVDGVDGLAKVKSESPDLILLDITMPEKSGVRFYRDVREDDALKSIPVVMVTGVTKDFERFISTRKQVPPPDGYISKPIDEKKLLDTITKLLTN